MHNNEFFHFLTRFLRSTCGFMSVIFWLLLIYGFDEPCEAGVTVLCALIHELGHAAYILCRTGDRARLRGALCGFRIDSGRRRSYREEVGAYAAGPLANVFASLLTLPFLAVGGGYASLFALINLLTAVSNLLPIKNYDGYGIMRAVLLSGDRSLFPLDATSFTLKTAACVLSLYAMERLGEGYWIFGVFCFSLISDMRRTAFLQK